MSQKDYRPTFSKGPSIPPIEAFRLDRILNNALKDEATQVVESLLNVTSNYQNDLRQEIRKSLSMEQKIQYKNIQIAKLISSLNHQITRRSKKVTKIVQKGKDDTENVLEVEVGELLGLTVEASDMAKRLTARMGEIEHKLGGSLEQYPHVHSILNKDNIADSAGGTNSADGEPLSIDSEEFPLKYDHNNDNYALNDTYDPKQASTYTEPESPVAMEIDSEYFQEPNGHSGYSKPLVSRNDSPTTSDPVSSQPGPPQNGSLQDILPEVSSISTEPEPEPEPEQKQEPQPELKPEDFESFLSSSIQKYRKQQSKKYEAFDPFKPESLAEPKKPRPTHNPLSLLYSSLINSPTYKDTSAPSHPFPTTISIKSPATIKSTLQTSHFKKLRINGSPITSETFRKLKEQKDKQVQQNGEDSESASLAEPVHVGTAGSTEPQTNGTGTDCGSRDLSLLDNLRLSSDDDAWGSSGLNTETEDDTSEAVDDGIASSDTSDSDSSKSGDDHISHTNKYYTSLQAQLKKRKDKGRKRKQREFETEASPTPKHQPSHYKLKPKRSILKTARGVNTPKEVQIASLISSEPRYENERSGLSALNNAYDDGGDLHEINRLTVRGTILSHMDPVDHESPHASDHEDRDDVSIRSITRLKNYM